MEVTKIVFAMNEFDMCPQVSIAIFLIEMENILWKPEYQYCAPLIRDEFSHKLISYSKYNQ